MKKTIGILILCILILGFIGCTQNDGPEKQVREFYVEFAELRKEDPALAVEKYVHFEDDSFRAFAIDAESNGYQQLSYEILELEKISDSLWAIKVSIVSNTGHFNGYHFVGIIDGGYKVIRNVGNIPAKLSQNFDLEEYLPTGEYIDFNDVFIETPIRKEN